MVRAATDTKSAFWSLLKLNFNFITDARVGIFPEAVSRLCWEDMNSERRYGAAKRHVKNEPQLCSLSRLLPLIKIRAERERMCTCTAVRLISPAQEVEPWFEEVRVFLELFVISN